MVFMEIVETNSRIREKLSIIKSVGISDESNSLFRAVLTEIKQVASTHFNLSLSTKQILTCIRKNSLKFPEPTSL